MHCDEIFNLTDLYITGFYFHSVKCSVRIFVQKLSQYWNVRQTENISNKDNHAQPLEILDSDMSHLDRSIGPLELSHQNWQKIENAKSHFQEKKF